MNYKYDVFLSHASSKSGSRRMKFIEDLEKSLEVNNFRCFYSPKSIKWGANWVEEIGEAIKTSRWAIFVISPAFMNREWTEKELMGFFSLQNKTGRRIVFPIVYDTKIEKVINKYPFLERIQMLPVKKTEVSLVVEKFKEEVCGE